MWCRAASALEHGRGDGAEGENKTGPQALLRRQYKLCPKKGMAWDGSLLRTPTVSDPLYTQAVEGLVASHGPCSRPPPSLLVL